MWLRRLALYFAVLTCCFGSCIAVAAWHSRTTIDLWHLAVPSLWTYESVSPSRAELGGWRRKDWDMSPSAGRFSLQHETITAKESDFDLRSETGGSRSHWAWHGIGWLQGHTGDPSLKSFTAVWTPTWLVIAALFLPMALYLPYQIRRRKRALVGHCRRCGYDLRATPERCPECGMIPRAKPVAKSVL